MLVSEIIPWILKLFFRSIHNAFNISELIGDVLKNTQKMHFDSGKKCVRSKTHCMNLKCYYCIFIVLIKVQATFMCADHCIRLKKVQLGTERKAQNDVRRQNIEKWHKTYRCNQTLYIQHWSPWRLFTRTLVRCPRLIRFLFVHFYLILCMLWKKKNAHQQKQFGAHALTKWI